MTQVDKDDITEKILQQITAKITWKVYLSIFISCIVTTASVVWTGATVYYSFKGRMSQNSQDISSLQRSDEKQDDRIYRLETCCQLSPIPEKNIAVK